MLEHVGHGVEEGRGEQWVVSGLQSGGVQVVGSHVKEGIRTRGGVLVPKQQKILGRDGRWGGVRLRSGRCKGLEEYS